MMGEAALVLPDEREFTLFLSNKALFTAERSYGKPMPRLFADMDEGFAGAIAAVFYGSLRKHHADVSEDEAADILMENVDAVMSALKEALRAALPDGEAEGNAPRPRAGKTSGGAGAKPGSTRMRSGKRPRAATN